MLPALDRGESRRIRGGIQRVMMVSASLGSGFIWNFANGLLSSDHNILSIYHFGYQCGAPFNLERTMFTAVGLGFVESPTCEDCPGCACAVMTLSADVPCTFQPLDIRTVSGHRSSLALPCLVHI